MRREGGAGVESVGGPGRKGTSYKAKREAIALRKRIGSKSKELKKATTKGVLPRTNRDLKL